ncbi:MAG: ABC transporter permease [Candidatus Rokuibacteriota bacterium]|nr:MAG: ABC transporter permease [Candidatus Rokubacteria bacterium]
MAGTRTRLQYVLRRLLQAVPVILAIVVCNFLLVHLAPGDAALVLAGEAGSATPEYMAQLRAKFQLDRPLAVQLLAYVKSVLMLDLGYSFRHDRPVIELILSRLGPTLLLMTTSLVVSVGVGVVLGALGASALNSWRDNLISVFALVSYATPLFWLGLMLIVVFSLQLGWFPTSGMESIGAFHEGWRRVTDVAWHLALPAATLSLFFVALYTRLMRASLLEQRGLEYVTAARAKGLSERRVLLRHVLRNAILPVVTMAGVQAGNLVGGSVIVETVFGWPGLGLLAFQSLFARDLNLLLGIFLLCACTVVLINLVVDLLYTVVDPRIEAR